MLRQTGDSPKTTLMFCQFASIEALSRVVTSDMTDLPCKDAGGTHRGTEGTEFRATTFQREVNDSAQPLPPSRAHMTTISGDGSVWRTVLEPADGLIQYALSPPLSCKENDGAEDKRVSIGRRRVSVKALSTLRAVLRPSDVSTLVRSLWPELREDGDRGKQRHGKQGPRAPHAASSSASGGEDPRQPSSDPDSSSSTPADLDFNASGLGVVLRLEDDSGTHFIPPPREALRHVEEHGYFSGAGVASDAGVDESFRFSPPQQAFSLSPPPFASTTRGTSGISASSFQSASETPSSSGLKGPTAASTGLEEFFVEKSDSRSVRDVPAFGFQAQPIIEASIGQWQLSYTTKAVGVHRRKPVAGKRTAVVAHGGLENTATLSLSSVRVIDLLQRVPCHQAFRELVMIGEPVLEPMSQFQEQAKPQTSSPPFTADNPCDGQGWSKERHHGRSSEGEGPSGDAATFAPYLHQMSRPAAATAAAQTTKVRNDDSGSSTPRPAVLVSFSKMRYSDGMSALSAEGEIPIDKGTLRGQAPAESSQEHDGQFTAQHRRDLTGGSSGTASSVRNPGDRDVRALHSLESGAGSSATQASSASSSAVISLDIGNPVAINWNPRTLVALWRVRDALTRAGTSGASGRPGKSISDDASEGTLHEDSTESSKLETIPTTSSSMKIQVAASRGMQVCCYQGRHRVDGGRAT